MKRTHTELPKVIYPPAPDSAISTVRALKQIKGLLEDYWTDIDEADEALIDKIRASIDDVDVMLTCAGERVE